MKRGLLIGLFLAAVLVVSISSVSALTCPTGSYVSGDVCCKWGTKNVCGDGKCLPEGWGCCVNNCNGGSVKTAFNAATHRCLGGIICTTAQTRCGDQCIDPKKYSACCAKSVYGYGTDPCVRAIPYNVSIQACCGGKALFTPKTQCCGAEGVVQKYGVYCLFNNMSADTGDTCAEPKECSNCTYPGAYVATYLIPVAGLKNATVSQRGLDLIKESEGFRSNVYICAAGKKTIGYGHVVKYGETFKSVNKTAAEAILVKDVKIAQNYVATYVKVPLTQNQYDALVDFTFNLGGGKLGSSTLLKYLNKGNYEAAANELPKWNKGGGKVLSGLVTRRAAEKALFVEPGPKVYK